MIIAKPHLKRLLLLLLLLVAYLLEHRQLGEHLGGARECSVRRRRRQVRVERASRQRQRSAEPLQCGRVVIRRPVGRCRGPGGLATGRRAGAPVRQGAGEAPGLRIEARVGEIAGVGEAVSPQPAVQVVVLLDRRELGDGGVGAVAAVPLSPGAAVAGRDGRRSTAVGRRLLAGVSGLALAFLDLLAGQSVGLGLAQLVPLSSLVARLPLGAQSDLPLAFGQCHL